MAANCKSAGCIPSPSSMIVKMRIPPAVHDTSILVELASREFSINSLTTDAGRWTTSPAAIRSTTVLGRAWIRGVGVDVDVDVDVDVEDDCAGVEDEFIDRLRLIVSD